MNDKYSTGIVYYCGDITNGIIKESIGLHGLRITNIAGINNESFALTDTNTFNVITFEKIGILNPNMIYSGKEHYVALTTRGDIYTWGIGEYGELGHGPKCSEIEVPTLLRHSTKFTSISCGYSHTCALDKKGNLFTWGQNFDRQLGLYNKSQSNLPKHAIVEDLVMTPKFVPLSLLNPIRSVSCGSRFTVVVTMSGEVWSWGSGECGQLGNGRCTMRDVPEKCISNDITTELFCDVACGSAHVLALTENGNIYVWGLNTKGQLGLGDIKVRQTPLHMELPNGHEVAKIYAEGHSSACITKSGQKLLTWGSGKDYRLMQGNQNNIMIPTYVNNFQDVLVEKFCFTQSQSLALVHTRLTKIFPTCGPQKGFSSLELYGCGFWDSDTIVVRFTKKDDEMAMPRSSHGQYVRPDLIICRPPKLNDVGLYDVTIAVNGIDFCSDIHVVDIYQDPILNGLIAPQIYNAKMESGLATLILSCSRLGIHAKKYGVSVRLYDDDDDTKDPIIAQGIVESVLLESKNETQNFYEDDEEMVAQSSLENLRATSLGNGEEEQTVVCKDVDLSPLLSPIDKGCVRLRAQISSNNHDYTEGSTERLICHWFSPTRISPSCSPFAGQREVYVTGTGLFPSSQVQVEALHTLKIPNPNPSDEEENDMLIFEVAVPVRSEGWEELSYTVPSLTDFFLGEDKKPPKVDVIEIEINFRTITGDILTIHPFIFHYYNPKSVEVSPKWIKRTGGSILTITGPGVLFYSEAAQIVMVDTRDASNHVVKYDEFIPVIDENGNNTNEWKITFTTPSLFDDEAGDGKSDDDSAIAFVGLLLDGISQPQDSELTRVNIFTEVKIPQTSFPSKGPVAVGSDLRLVATGLHNTGICKLRIISSNDLDAFIECNGIVDNDGHSFTFNIPQTILNLFPEGYGPKYIGTFYIEISIDGSTYDRTADAYLQIKP